MAELHECINRINELRTKEFSGTPLSDPELREVFELLSEVRKMRSGKSPEKAKTPANIPDAEDYF